MKKSILILSILLITFSFSFSQEVITKTDLAKKNQKNIVFESVLKDAEFRPQFYRKERLNQDCSLGWWTLKFENGAVIRVYKKDSEGVISGADDIWWIGKKYVVIRKKVLMAQGYLEVRLLEEEKKEAT